ncbi:MAG: [protein-PII] uridylyltransferase [Acidimicrobiales bacterium]
MYRPPITSRPVPEGSLRAGRQALLDDTTTRGGTWCAAYAALVDGWLAEVLDGVGDAVDDGGVSLVAVGGYGRAELCPGSDIDLLLLHRGRSDIAEVAERVWYPIWDEGVKLGHSVRTVREAVTLADDDLDTATSLLTTRHVAGDAELTADLAATAAARWRKRAKRWLAQLSRSVDDRHTRAGEVAFLLEPDLKEGRGGLRDVHALRWAEAARAILVEGDAGTLEAAYATLLDTRVELQRRTGRRSDQLLLQEQDAVAAALGHDDADDLMRAVSGAARTIAWTSDDTWARVGSTLRGPLGWVARRDRPLGESLVLRDGEVHVTPEAVPAEDPALVLRAAAAAAAADTAIDRASLERLAAEAPAMPDPWPVEARDRLTDLLCAGTPAVRTIEALDQKGIWVRILPEWEPNRSRPQRNAYHRFTVDRHLIEAAVNAGRLVDRVTRPDLLVIGTLLHDIGKGYPGDHSVVGQGIVRTIGRRMGYGDADVGVLVTLVRHHLLLPDVATRRDLDDPGTIAQVAEAVGEVEVLRLLDALTEADSLATGPAAWGGWKAGLVHELTERVAHVLGGGAVSDVVTDDFPSAEHRAMMAAGRQVLEGREDELTVVTPDRPGVFAEVAGVLALHGLAVREAAAHSGARGDGPDDEPASGRADGPPGMALARFRVEPSFGPVVAWHRIIADLERVFAGRLALQARLDERARTYAGRGTTRAAAPVRTAVAVDNRSSATATVLDVQAADSIGLLHRITRALAELDLDIRSAKVQTIGPQVVDAFYVTGRGGGKITDDAHLSEIERAVLHAVSSVVA